MELDRSKAYSLLTEYTQSESLIKHALGVEAAMRWYAEQFAADELLWGITGLLHDFDYERYPTPTPDGHPFVGCAILKDQGYPTEMISAILGHAQYSGVPRETALAKTLFAVDELSGLITAAALVRPDRSLLTLERKSILKKMKDKAFAKGVNREDVVQGAAELGVALDQHIDNVLAGMRLAAADLGLAGV